MRESIISLGVILAFTPWGWGQAIDTMPVYALGFPRGRSIQAVVGNIKDNPAITVNPMSISSLRKDESSRLARVQLNGSAIEGNSGGPLVDAKGRLVGVIVSRIRGEAVGFAVPPSVIAQFLEYTERAGPGRWGICRHGRDHQ